MDYLAGITVNTWTHGYLTILTFTEYGHAMWIKTLEENKVDMEVHFRN